MWLPGEFSTPRYIYAQMWSPGEFSTPRYSYTVITWGVQYSQIFIHCDYLGGSVLPDIHTHVMGPHYFQIFISKFLVWTNINFSISSETFLERNKTVPTFVLGKNFGDILFFRPGNCRFLLWVKLIFFICFRTREAWQETSTRQYSCITGYFQIKPLIYF